MIAMVSNMSVLQFPISLLRSDLGKCNWCAVLCRGGALALALLSTAVLPIAAPPQPTSALEPGAAAVSHEHRVLDSVKFLAGAGLGLVMHETGHLVFDAMFDADPRIKGVRFGPFPFF